MILENKTRAHTSVFLFEFFFELFLFYLVGVCVSPTLLWQVCITDKNYMFSVFNRWFNSDAQHKRK